MLARYSHVRVDAKRNALDALSKASATADAPRQPQRSNSVGAERGYDTNNDTSENESGNVPAQLLERNGRHVGTRTPDLYRVKVAL